MSTHREIEEVYLEDINKKQKMSKGIVAESLGEINKMGAERGKLSKEELLAQFESAWRGEISRVSEEAYQQIKEIIQNLP